MSFAGHSRSRDSTFSQSSDSPSFVSNSPSLNQRPRAPPDFTSTNRIHMPPTRSNANPNPYSDDLVPPTRPFGTTPASNRSSLTSLSTGSQKGDKDDKISTSLSVNYLPSKFSRPHSPGLHPRRTASNQKLNGKNAIRGGGVAAFRAGESRLPGTNDDDYDGVQVNGWGSVGSKSHRLRWNKFKWILFVMNTIFTVYSMVALIFCILTWLNVWDHAEIIQVANNTELILSTVASALGVLTSLLGWAGILLNNRAFLATYTLLLWVCFGLLVSPGYVTYKTRTFNLEGKINHQWSRILGANGRLQIQNKLECCGYYSPFVEATFSQTCFARSLLNGCKNPLLNFEKTVLTRWYTVSFALVPLQLGMIFTGLLCSNHITYRFGKGMMPKAYRLSLTSMGVIMDNYAQQLAEQYGDDVASDVLSRSRNKLSTFSSGVGAGGTAPSSPLQQSFSSLNNATNAGGQAVRATGTDMNRGYSTYSATSAVPSSTTGSGGAPPSSYPGVPAGGGGGGRRNSGYANYGGSNYQMSTFAGGAGGQDDRRI